MPSTVEQINPTRVKMTLTIPFAELKPAIDKAYRQVASQVTIPGFRRGKVPPRIIDQRVGRGAIINDAINAALPDLYAAAIEEHGLTPMGNPDIEMTKMEDGDAAEFTAEFDVRPQFDLPDFSALQVVVDPAVVTESDIDERIALLRERFATTAEVDRAAKAGDVVMIDLVGTRNGEELADASARGIAYVVGTGGMLEGLDEAVTGLSAGESATFASKLVGGQHEGEEADITVTVTRVDEVTLPEVDDEFAQLVSAQDTVAAMRADLRGAAERLARMDQLRQARDRTLTLALETAEFPVPEKTLANEVAARHSQVEEQLAQLGVTLEEYIARINRPEEGRTADEFWAKVSKAATAAVRTQILLGVVGDERGISVSQEDLSAYIVQRAQQSGRTPEQELDHMRDHDHTTAWIGDIRNAKALDAIMRDATITDTNGQRIDIGAAIGDPLQQMLSFPSDAPLAFPEDEPDEDED